MRPGIHHAIVMVTNMSAASLEQAVIDDEIVGMAVRVLRGIDTAGKPYLRRRAAARVAKLLADHPRPGLPPEIETAIRARFPVRA